MKLFFKKKRVRAHIDVLPARNQPSNDLVDLRMKQRLATRDRHHGRTRFLDRPEALVRTQLLLEDVGRVLNLPAAGAGQIAAEERLQHRDQREALPSFDL